MRQAHATSRLARLPDVARISFAAGALQHVHLCARSAWQNEPLVLFLDRALEFSFYSVDNPFNDNLDRFFVGEDDPSMPGQADLIDGMRLLFKLTPGAKPGRFRDIASYAYQATLEMALPLPSGGDLFLKAE